MNSSIQLDKIEILPGENRVVQLNVGRLPSGNRINIFVHVYNSPNPGPCALIMAGVHGDEINGIEIVRRTIQNEIYSNLNRGSVIAIPVLNIYGFINFSREVPDGKDVNRSFPGNLRGSLASRVARLLTKTVLNQVDFVIDFHTGGNSRFNHPQIRYTKKDTKAKELAIAFSPSYIIEKPALKKSLRRIALDYNIPVLVYEAGESVRLDGVAIENGINGLKRVLYHLNMISYAPESNVKPIICSKSSWIRAPHSGIFIWSKRSGQPVRKSEPLGEIYDPQGSKSITVLSSRSGYILGHNNASVVNQGDALFHLGYSENI